MNKISEIRKKVQENGTATINIDDFNILQAEWITRCGIQLGDLAIKPNTAESVTIAELKSELKCMQENEKSLIKSRNNAVATLNRIKKSCIKSK